MTTQAQQPITKGLGTPVPPKLPHKELDSYKSPKAPDWVP